MMARNDDTHADALAQRLRDLLAADLPDAEWQAALKRLVRDIELAKQARYEGTRCPDCHQTECGPDCPAYEE